MPQSNNVDERRSSLHGFWSSKMAFILAVTGSAVGLGNIWKFPYIAGENGGGAFVLIYLLCVFAIGLPIMMAETMLGRSGRRNPVASMALLGEEEGGSSAWGLVGLSGVIAGFLILSYYSVIAGWVLAYVFKSASGVFLGSDADFVRGTIEALTGDWMLSGAWHSVFMLMTVIVVVQKNVESGERTLGLQRDIQKRYNVSASKAKFLARQETNLLGSEIQRQRYKAAGSEEYTWRTVVGTKNHPVRPSHKVLNNTIQRWDAPPITNAKGDRNHPRQDFGCRCQAIPIIRFTAE